MSKTKAKPTGSGSSIPPAPLISELSLWPHQVAAIKQMRIYFRDSARGRATGSALVHMPTGSGKTGVIATLSRCAPEINGVLILTPRVALRRQLVRDVKSRFFERLEKTPGLQQIPKTIVELTGTVPQLTPKSISDTVFVSTIQKLQSMFRGGGASFDMLVQNLSLLIFDEGHYEPAYSWSQLVRQISAPKIILTATPYRNDLKVFDLDLRYAYSYTYKQAVKDRYLRDVEIVQREKPSGAEEFIDDILEAYDQKYGGNGNSAARVIIRCDRRSAIRQLAGVLNLRGRKVVAIHERFSDVEGEDYEWKTVPDPETVDATFWIHQFKLLEGIDDSRFQMVAMFQPFSSARQLIQQVGRATRNPGKAGSAKAQLLDHSEGFHSRLWEGFRRYDAKIDRLGAKGLELAVGASWLPELIEAQPGFAYIGGRFRSPLDLDNLLPDDELQLPLSVNLIKKSDDFSLQAFSQAISQEYGEQDRQFREFEIDEATRVFVYISISNSALLRASTFMEPKLGVTIVRDLGDLIGFFDSMGFVPRDSKKYAVGKSISSDDLERLFTDDEGSYLTGLSLRNSNLAVHSIRAKSFRAAKVRETVSGFDDHAQIMTIATGYSVDDPLKPFDRARRYVGFSRGRVSEASDNNNSIAQYIDWLDHITKLLTKSSKGVPTFRRYATSRDDVEDPTPIHILLDLFEVEDSYRTLASKDVKAGEIMDIPDMSFEISKGNFTVKANGTSCAATISYDANAKRYLIASDALDRLYESADPEDSRGIVDYLNQEQSFRVIPKSKGVIFVLGQFYMPTFKIGSAFNADEFELIKILFPLKRLESIDEEKHGNYPGGMSGWDPNSLFGVIDALGAGASAKRHFGSPNIVVCDDMQTEVADFILADTKKSRVVFIHAKASKPGHKYSASALQEVCGQATKNINYIGMFNSDRPPNIKLWKRPWPNGKKPKVTDRIRRGSGSAIKVWSEIQSVISNPLAEREVWLFLGQTLSKSALEEHLSKASPTPEAVQAALLLHATMSSVASAGAKLKVFCSP